MRPIARAMRRSEVERRTTISMLLLATSLLAACQGKADMPRAAKRLMSGRANPMVIIGNGAAYGRILGKIAGTPR